LFEPARPIARLFAGRYEVAGEVEIIFKKSLAAPAAIFCNSKILSV
jgi:hypothetical protein